MNYRYILDRYLEECHRQEAAILEEQTEKLIRLGYGIDDIEVVVYNNTVDQT